MVSCPLERSSVRVLRVQHFAAADFIVPTVIIVESEYICRDYKKHTYAKSKTEKTSVREIIFTMKNHIPLRYMVPLVVRYFIGTARCASGTILNICRE